MTSDSKRVMPTKPGWWWATVPHSKTPHPVQVDQHMVGWINGIGIHVSHVKWTWIAPIPQPAELLALEAVVEAARIVTEAPETQTPRVQGIYLAVLSESLAALDAARKDRP